MFEAIVGDPPYGVRAGGRMSRADARPVRCRATHIPATDPYPLTRCINDLLDLAARTLVVGAGMAAHWRSAQPAASVAPAAVQIR